MYSHSLVTVICSCYNHESFIIETLESVKQQSHTHLQLIVIDDCSTDHTVNVIEPWLIKNPDVLFIQNTQNLGITQTFNKAAQHAQGTFIMDLAADDVLYPHTIENQLRAFSQYPLAETAIVFGNAWNIDAQGNPLAPYFPENHPYSAQANQPVSYKMLLQGGNCMCSVSALINRKLFESLNGYDETLAYEDLDYWLRASRHFKIYYENQIWVKKRILPNSLGSSFLKKDARTAAMQRSTLRIFQKARHMNRDKFEDDALLHRVHFALKQSLKHHNLIHALKLLVFKLKLSARKH